MPGIDVNTISCLHMDGANGGTTFTDSSLTPLTYTALGNAQTSTANPYFGSAAGLFDGTGDAVKTDSDTPYLLGTGSFTFDMRVYITTAIILEGLCGYIVNTNDSYSLYIDATNIYFKSTVSGSVSININAAHGMSINTYYHIAVVRNGNNFNIYVNGTSVASGSSGNSLTTITGGTFRIGECVVALTFADFRGNIDEFRSSNIARWTSDFTPPSSAYDSNLASTNVYRTLTGAGT